MLTIKILRTTENDVELVGKILLKEGQLYFNPEPGDSGNKLALERIQEYDCIVDGGTRLVTRVGDPEAWMRALPENFNGSYLRAQLLEELTKSDLEGGF